MVNMNKSFDVIALLACAHRLSLQVASTPDNLIRLLWVTLFLVCMHFCFVN